MEVNKMEHYCHNKECKFYKDKYRPHSILIDGIYPTERRIQRHRWKMKELEEYNINDFKKKLEGLFKIYS